MMLKKIGLVGSIALLAACAGTPVKEEPGYDPTSSHAMNVWRASGMGGGMKDTKVPKEEVGNFWDSGSGQLLGIYSDMRMADFGGLDSNFVGGVGLALALLEPDEPPQRNSVFYWTEKNGMSGDEALKKMTETFISASKNGLNEIGVEVIGGKLEPKITDIKQGLGTGIFIKIPGSKYCKETIIDGQTLETPCFIHFWQPKKALKEVGGNKILGVGESWYQSAEDKSYFSKIDFKIYSGLGINNDEGFEDVDQVGILQAISKKMPKQFYIYLAPNKINGKEGKALKQPLLIDSGKVFAFISSK